MILFLNGAFGVGKSTTARALRVLEPSIRIVDPERLGWLVQCLPGAPADFQDSAMWRRGVVTQIRVAHTATHPVVVPMAFSELSILDELARGVARAGPVHRVCLHAPWTRIHERLLARGFASDRDRTWVLRRSRECVAAHADPRFGLPIDARGPPRAVAMAVLASLAT